MFRYIKKITIHDMIRYTIQKNRKMIFFSFLIGKEKNVY